MKRLPSVPTSSGADHKKINVSQSEVQRLIEQEVHSAVKTNETKMQCLIETIESLDRGVDFERTIQKLETRINTLTKRAEAALTYVTKTQKKTPRLSPVNVDIIRIDSDDEAVETGSQTSTESADRTGKSGELSQVMKTTKEELMKMRADNEAWTAAMADLRAIAPPPVLSPQGSPEFNERCAIRKNVDRSRTIEEPKAATVREGSPSSGSDNVPRHAGSGQTRINTLTKRAEAALAYVTNTQKKSPRPSPVNVDIIRIDSDDEAVETGSQTGTESADRTGKSGEFSQVTETTKEELMKMRADNEAWTAAMADLRAIAPPPVLSPQGSPEFNGRCAIQKNVDKSRTIEEPKAATVREGSPSSGSDNVPRHAGSGQRKDKPSYPPLPSATAPSVLDSEAASFNVPQAPEVHLALIRDPPGLSVLWKIVEEDPCAPPMDSYSVFMTSEKVKGSGVFPKWKLLGEVKAIALPMCVMVTKYKPGHNVCVAVVGKDRFGRCGPYSKVVTAAIPASLG